MSRRRRLVVAHLDKVSAKVLEDYPDIIRSMIKGRSGVYALYRSHSLHYVGLANNLMRRLKQHLRDRHVGRWDRFSVYLTVHDEHTKELESLILRIVAPKGNRTSGKFMDSKDLRRELKQEMKAYDAKKRSDLLGARNTRSQRKVKTQAKKGAAALQGLVKRRTRLRGYYKGYEYSGWLRKDGRIYYDGEIYNSPSGAARAIVKHSVSGWGFWRYRNRKGEWVRLGAIRT